MSAFISRFAIAAVLMHAASAAFANDIVGRWETGESRVDIYACGDLLCGRIAELDEPLDENGKPKLDVNNPDTALRSRPILGMDLIAGFSRAGKRKWEDGTIYDPRDGKTYKCVIKLQRNGSLKVRGYVGIPLLGKTVVWTRAE
ncbi:MAG: DUF2147 domain-containing protein [Immundisolibacterales bacterium]|nr:DUF2147 domain-containing protein [Immundisolibacterales bacterium]